MKQGDTVSFHGFSGLATGTIIEIIGAFAKVKSGMTVLTIPISLLKINLRGQK